MSAEYQAGEPVWVVGSDDSMTSGRFLGTNGRGECVVAIDTPTPAGWPTSVGTFPIWMLRHAAPGWLPVVTA